jgi:hypothetical protein
MCSLLGIGDFQYRSIRDAASCGVMPRHKGAGNKSYVAIKDDDPCMIHLRNHFNYLYKLGKVRATKMIVKVVDGACGPANREDTDRNIYWPISMGYCNCYYCYMESLGYKVKVGPNGTLTAEGVEGTKDTFVSLSTYYLKWKTNHPSLKVSWPAEDICYNCYNFANKHNILSSHTYTTEDGEGIYKEMIISGNYIDVNDLVNLLNNTRLDKPEPASTKVEEAKELLILECAKHIDIARAQRILYQSLEAAAVCNAKNGVEYSKRKPLLQLTLDKTFKSHVTILSSQVAHTTILP